MFQTLEEESESGSEISDFLDKFDIVFDPNKINEKP
jgi:hypothetical protein